MTDALNRRELLRRAAAGGAFLTVPGVLAACGGSSNKAAGTTSGESKTLAKTLRFSNWTLYIDVNEKTKSHPTLDAFKKKTGTTVQYTEDINDNASYFGKIQGPLSRGQSIDRDIIVMTDNSRYPSLLIKKGWLEKLDKSAIPNIANLEPALQHPNWDPNRDYSLPWQSGMTGIAYNDKLTDPVLSMDDLLDNPKLKGKITLLNEMGQPVIPKQPKVHGDLRYDFRPEQIEMARRGLTTERFQSQIPREILGKIVLFVYDHVYFLSWVLYKTTHVHEVFYAVPLHMRQPDSNR